MKRIKIMMLSLALFAVVGGALAFKTKFNQNFCYTIVDAGTSATACHALACPDARTGQKDNTTGASKIYCTFSGTNCNSNTICSQVAAVSLTTD